MSLIPLVVLLHLTTSLRPPNERRRMSAMWMVLHLPASSGALPAKRGLASEHVGSCWEGNCYSGIYMPP